MIAQVQNHLRHLVLYRSGKAVALGVKGTGHGEILPDEDAIFVAKLVETVCLIDITAPAPNHITIQISSH